MKDVSNSTAQGFEKVRQQYREKLPGKLDRVRDKWSELRENGWRESIAREIHVICHRLTGTGEPFGFPNISRLSRIVSQQLNRLFDSDEAPTQARFDELGAAIQALVVDGPLLDEQKKTGSSSPDRMLKSVPPNEAVDMDAFVRPLSLLPIYVVEDDREYADLIVMELANHGYDGRAVYDLADLDYEMRRAGVAPGAIIMDIVFPDAVTGGIDIINKFRHNHILKAPVIFISASDSFSTRLKIIRAGGEAFFVKPLDIPMLIEKIELLIGEVNPDPLRILVVDDDRVTTRMVCTVLKKAGLDARGINNPTTIINEILEYRPDLVVLDMYMPEVNGMELAQILRQHESCNDIPLLFLSSESNSMVRAAALNIGVDDFLIKPFDNAYMVSAIANRAQRARALRRKIYRDSLTNLLVHDEIKNQLADQLSTAKRYNRPLSYAMIDIDRFKSINDTYGHLMGDHILKSLSSLLRRSFRRSDIIGRYGGEEFVVIMLDTDTSQAMIVINRLREEFSKTVYQPESGGKGFHVTFSAGISSYPEFKNMGQIQQSADAALYAAKDAGRNRICMA